MLRALLVVMAAIAATTCHAESYKFSYVFGSGARVEGSFSGTATGNLVTELSDIHATLDGVSLGEQLFPTGYVPNSWIAHAAVASFDGRQNSFLFGNVDFPTNYALQSYFYIVTAIDVDGTLLPEALATLTNDGAYAEIDNVLPNRSPYDPARWSLVEVVPEPATIVLSALALAAALFGRYVGVTKSDTGHEIARL